MDPVAEYQSALTALQAAESNAESIAKSIAAVGIKASHWKTLMISNTDVRFPMEIGLNPQHVSIDFNQWPSISEFRDALQTYHDLRSEIKNAWSRIPADRRVGLSAPS